MQLSTKFGDLRQALRPIVMAAGFVAICVAIFWFLPIRTAAMVLGVFIAVVIYYVFLTPAQKTTQIAILWAAVAVTADAAYAKLNDQAPVTVVNGIGKIVDALFKLGEGIVRGVGVNTADARGKMLSVAPEFLWALILATIVLIVLSPQVQRPAARPSQGQRPMPPLNK